MSFACPHIRIALLLALCGLALSSPSAAQAGAPRCPTASAVPAQSAERSIVRATLCVLNAQRDKRGVAPLRLSSRLSKAARGHARDMARKDYFSHDSLSGESFVDRIKDSGYLDGARSWRIGENIAWATGSLSSPREIVQSWMRSAGHRANILSGAFDQIGIGVARDAPIADAGPGGTYATDFGARG